MHTTAAISARFAIVQCRINADLVPHGCDRPSLSGLLGILIGFLLLQDAAWTRERAWPASEAMQQVASRELPPPRTSTNERDKK